MILQQVHEICRQAVKSAFDVEPESVSVDFSDKFGDLALNCFYLAKTLRQAPPKIAAAVAEAIESGDLVESAVAVSGYVNLTLVRTALFAGALEPVIAEPETFGAVPAEDDAPRMMIEFSSPNTNKPQHLGHVRNNCLGESLSRITEATGTRVVRANVVNDRGIHICKSMLAYQREGNGATPESSGKKGDHFVGEYYILFERRLQAELKELREAETADAAPEPEELLARSQWQADAQNLLQLWEDGDEETLALWRRMNAWVMEGFQQTYGDFGIRFDRIYLESDTYRGGKEIIERGLEAGVFYRRDDGAVEIDLTAEKLDKKVVLRSDGTSVYMTQDIGATPKKAEEFGLSGQIFVVGDEQIYHFKVLFSILEKLGYAWASNLHHLAYGMVHLPKGMGRMKSREGTVVDADNLVDEVTELARQEIITRNPEEDPEKVGPRARQIGLAALKFMILNVSPQTTMTYDPKASVQFDGDTGPYILYAYARIRRMIEDSGIETDGASFEAAELGDPSELRLALKILQFPGIARRAARDLNPSLIAGFLLQLARAYHSHNHDVPILKAENPATRQARLCLSYATAQTLERGLSLLGIETVDRM